ncbi:hypothetical protein J1N35_024112 [Gossypium stocksii]|uniref:Uncharacterized protein n=1 Tax=Gossypium stocksii TaxID=47602 RepID=A0A9D4A2P7_9ROSI|nr:hypothetical protein J1N35_024112 [Gossypium stocksii]
MFNAILWKSKNEIPTNPISNPIIDFQDSPEFQLEILASDPKLKILYVLLPKEEIIAGKAYTSNEELNSPLTSTIEKLLLSPKIVAKGSMNGEHKLDGYDVLIALYKLLHEVWLIQFVSVGFISQLQRKLQLEA